jgi:hypothetical protein
VPVGRLRIANANPVIETISELMKISEGTRREKPSDLFRAVAHTASKVPDTTNTSQAITHLFCAVLSLAGYGAPRPVSVADGFDGSKRTSGG